MKTFRISFPRRVRIHGGECGAVARALHHEVQKDALIPYEQMSFPNQADLKKAFRSTFNERKQMSNKTSIKRLALVAVSALGIGLVSSVAPASAAPTIAYTTMVDTTLGYQTVGGIATVTITPDAGSTNRVEITGGSLVSSTLTDGGADGDGSYNTSTGYYVAGDATDTLALRVTRADAGTVVVKVTPFNNDGTLGTAVSKTVTFIVVTQLDISAANTDVWLVANEAACTAATAASTTTYISATAADDSAAICVQARNGLDALITNEIDVTITSSGVGNVNAAAVSAAATDDADGVIAASLGGNGLAGVGTYTITISDDSGSITKTASVTFAGATAGSASLTQSVYALDDDAAATVVASFTVLDTKGSIIAKADDDAASLVVDSDIASTSVIDVAGEEDAEATVVITRASSLTALGVHTTGQISVTCAGGKYEKISIKMHLASDTVASNTITVYCTESVADVTTETIDFSVAAANAGGEQTVTATVKAGLTGKDYPVADGDTVSFSSSGGTVVTAAPTTLNGSASTKLYAAQNSGTYKFTGAAGGASKTVDFVVSGGAAEAAAEAAADAAAEAIDAANAATDAANLAAEAADAATVAAEEARDAADAATAAVEELATQVATLMAALKAQITTLANTVAKIAKKVRA